MPETFKKRSKPQRLVVNGKFYSAQMTGVHRVAEELLHALDDAVDAGQGPLLGEAEILIASDARSKPEHRNIRTSKPGRLPWIPWEQLELPWLARNDFLVSLCNLAPFAYRGGLVMIHDAQVYISPDSYSKPFLAWYHFLLPNLARNSACVLTVSEFSKAQLVHYGVTTPDKIRVVHNGVDHMLRSTADFAAFERLGLERNKFVLALANTQAHKNIGVLLKAFAAMQDPSLKLVLIGGAKKEEFEAKGEVVPPNVVFAGRVSDDELRGLMERALCFACPSLTEGFGLPPLEAMLVGCPAVIAPCGALPEVCADAALRADPHDPAAWLDAIMSLHTDDVLRQKQVAAGIERASYFTWKRSAGILIDAINDYTKAA